MDACIVTHTNRSCQKTGLILWLCFRVMCFFYPCFYSCEFCCGLTSHCYFSWKEVQMFFSEVFIGCKSISVCARECVLWTWLRIRELMLHTCRKPPRVLKWTLSGQTLWIYTDVEILYISSLALTCSLALFSLALCLALFLSAFLSHCKNVNEM